MSTKVEAGATTNYTYDAENRLIKVVKNGSTIGQYEYDGDGGRTKKTSTINGRTTTTTYVGSLFETDTTGRNTRHIFFGDQRIAAVTSSPSLGTSTLYYHTDHLGGTNVLTDSTGFKKELIEYEPYGNESRHEKYGSSEEVAWYYFTGKPKDDETGLIYFGARYYDPTVGRFITADTIVPSPTNPQTLNRYSYAGNNPVSHIEDGHGFWKSFFRAVTQAFITAVLTPFIGLPLAAAAGAAASTAAFGGSGREIGMNAGIAFATAGIVSKFGVNSDTGQLTNFGKGMIGVSLVGGLAYAASTDGWAGVENFAGSFLGATVGAFAGKSVAQGIQGVLANPATKQGGNQAAQVDESIKQVKEGNADRTSLLQSANNSKGDVQGFTAKVEAYTKLSGQAVDHQVESGAFKFTARGVSQRMSGQNWNTIGIGLAEISGGIAGLGSALAIEAGSLGAGSLVAGWRAYSSVITMGIGAADVMLGLYGESTSAELIADALSNNPFGQRIYQMTPVGSQ